MDIVKIIKVEPLNDKQKFVKVTVTLIGGTDYTFLITEEALDQLTYEFTIS